MTESESPKPQKPNSPNFAANSQRKPLQVMHISRKLKEASQNKDPHEEKKDDSKSAKIQEQSKNHPNEGNELIKPSLGRDDKTFFKTDFEDEDGLSMEMIMANEEPDSKQTFKNQAEFSRGSATLFSNQRVVDEFDFDEDEFLAALEENVPVGNTGETAKGKVIEVESDGVYVDIGGKAPGFMPKKECGLGVITGLKEKFPKGLEVEVLVTREQNADGIVTISCRALALRKSWEKVGLLEKEGKVVQVKINGFNRGGVTCDLEGLRGFIPRSQLENGENHETLVGKTIGTAFLEVNPESRKLVLSEKKAAIAKLFSELELGQLVEGRIASIKQYGYFVDLGGFSGLLHHSSVTNGNLRSLSEVFKKGDIVKALITDLDPRRARIGLNTALLEGPPGEILKEKEKIMAEAEERALKAQETLKKAQTTE